MLSLLLTGAAAALAAYWFRSQQLLQRPIPLDHGEVIFHNAPLAGTAE